ncbi:tyrosine-type recombinase/integrase [Nocardia mangyaensis]|uniref:tyrosine-type recombinase/integrase n=1 Tax=Nocardia mangyaensis TaxID=2213200 RepID=UPI000A05B1B8
MLAHSGPRGRRAAGGRPVHVDDSPTVPEKKIPVPPMEARRKVLADCEGTAFEDRRDSAIIGLMVDAGPRIGEIAPLDVEALDFAENTVLVLGKGRRPRTLPLGDRTRTTLRRYLRARARRSPRLPRLAPRTIAVGRVRAAAF